MAPADDNVRQGEADSVPEPRPVGIPDVLEKPAGLVVDDEDLFQL